jgi:UDP:flavonoid glycosyltransferase YjiC (YdhE family)
LAVASGGGHWVQLRKIAKAFGPCDLAFVTVNEEYRQELKSGRFYSVVDANKWTKRRMLKMSLQLLRIVWKERPDFVVSTGAAPGLIAIAWAKLLIGSRTAWIDSIANAQQLSSSGQQAGRFADLWLTQWEELSKPDGPGYAGTVL